MRLLLNRRNLTLLLAATLAIGFNPPAIVHAEDAINTVTVRDYSLLEPVGNFSPTGLRWRHVRKPSSRTG